MVGGIAGVATGAAVKGATSALVKGFMDHVVSPFMAGRKNKKELISRSRAYLRSLDQQTKYIPTIAVQGGKFSLDEVYEPLRLRSKAVDVSYLIDRFPDEIFDINRCVVVVDSAGMGKSTLTKYILRKCLVELKRIPVLVELRRMSVGGSILELICQDFVRSPKGSQLADALVDAMEDGNFLILLDGYDELSDEVREAVSSEIVKMSSAFPHCQFWLTSRPDPALSSFAEFAVFEVSPLEAEQAFSLLHRYDGGGRIAGRLITKIRNSGQIREFLRVPLLVTLLYKAFDYKAVVPLKKNLFFRQVFDALYQDHDLSKEGAYERRKKSALDLDEFHKVLRAIGFITFKKSRIQFPHEQFVSVLEDAIQRAGLKADVGKLRQDLISAVPVFVKEGADYRWAHKSFQDYFAAQFIYYDSGARRELVVRSVAQSERLVAYRGILELIAELDYDLVHECCVLPYLISERDRLAIGREDECFSWAFISEKVLAFAINESFKTSTVNLFRDGSPATIFGALDKKVGYEGGFSEGAGRSFSMFHGWGGTSIAFIGTAQRGGGLYRI